jgi:hypothetical protein
VLVTIIFPLHIVLLYMLLRLRIIDALSESYFELWLGEFTCLFLISAQAHMSVYVCTWRLGTLFSFDIRDVLRTSCQCNICNIQSSRGTAATNTRGNMKSAGWGLKNLVQDGRRTKTLDWILHFGTPYFFRDSIPYTPMSPNNNKGFR